LRKASFPAVLAAATLALVLTGVHNSPGKALRETALDYSGSLASGLPDSARVFLTDSLAALAGPGLFQSAAPPAGGGDLTIGREEARGFPALIRALEGGSSRTIWMRREGHGWAVSGDTWLDGLLGSAAVICRNYAVSILPLISAGSPAGGFACPISGLPYFMDESMGTLRCPSGHLGDGLGTGSGQCEGRRGEVTLEVRGFLDAGYGFPSTLEEMWQLSSGEFGQRGGYRCPDNGYSYYELLDSTVWCPFHEAGSPIPAAGGVGG
jgi:hypothetical protein